MALTHELSTNTSSRQALLENDEKIKDLQKENSILRESNNKLLDSAYSVEVERQFHARENALKVGKWVTIMCFLQLYCFFIFVKLGHSHSRFLQYS